MAGFVGMAACRVVAVVGNGVGGGSAVRIGERDGAAFAEKGEFDGDLFVQERAEVIVGGDDGLTGEGALPVYVGRTPHFVLDGAEGRETLGSLTIAVEENEVPVARSAVERAAVVEK